MIGYICCEVGVVCVVNGDVVDRWDGYKFMEEFRVDGVMIVMVVEKNLNVFLKEGEEKIMWE